jgi:mono/diheme cytochrome c family protein
LTACVALPLTFLVGGCRQDMHNQPKFIPQRGTTFFADGRSARPQVEHTVARGQLHEDSYLYTGLVAGENGYKKEVDLMPFPATIQVLERGQERYNVYCSPCHSRVGNGAGMIVQRGYKPAGNFHDQVHLSQPLGHYFYVMTHGYGAMPDYSAQLTAQDRWAVAAYIRALQMSQNSKLKDLPDGTQIQIRELKDVAIEEGYPATYAGPWEMPNTAVQAMPGPGTPAMAPASGAEAPSTGLNGLPITGLQSGSPPSGAKNTEDKKASSAQKQTPSIPGKQ